MRLLIALYCFLSVHLLYAQQVQLHTDRTYYFPGDTVWYKVYLTHAGIPDTAIRNLSVAIGQPDGKVLEHHLRPVIKGATFGQYVIPGGYKEHELYFNLYSKRKQDNPFVAKVGVYQEKHVVSDSKPSVQVFVDGGCVLPAMPNRLSFQWNVRSEIKGRICDKAGIEIASFTTDASGRASVECKPEGADLSLHWSHLGREHIDPIPACCTGARLRLEEVGDTVRLVVENRSAFRNVTLRFSPEPETTWQKDIHFGWDQVQSFTVEELLGGPYAGDFELVYQDSVLARMRTDHFRPVEPELTVGELSFAPFGRNSFDLLIPDDNTWNLSISVHDGLLPDVPHDPDPPVYQTAGRYGYSYPKKKGEEEFRDAFYTLKGRIKMPDRDWAKFWEARHKRGQQLEKKDKLLRDASFGYRLLTEADFRYEEVDYDSLGNLRLRDIIFYDTLQTRIVQIDSRLNMFDYEMDWQFSDIDTVKRLVIPDFVAGRELTHLYTGKYDPDYYTHPSGERFIKEVGVSRKKVDPYMQKLQKQYSRGWFDRESVIDIDLLNEGIPGYVYTVNELSEYLVKKYPLIAKLVYRDPITHEIIVLANNMHLSNMPKAVDATQDLRGVGVEKVNPNLPRDVSEIVFARVYEKYTEDPSGRGIIMYYTSGVNARNKDIGVAKIALSKVAGYNGFHDFHHKNYNEENLPDYDDRQTLYWNPDVQLSGRVTFPITFYNNTLSDSYAITVQGLSSSGRTFRFSRTITKEGFEFIGSSKISQRGLTL